MRTKNGVIAKSQALSLAGGGKDEAEAVQSLQRVATAFCASLARIDGLESALRRAQVRWEPNGSSIMVEVVGRE